MFVEETFYRPDELSRESRMLPAESYNLAHRLISHAKQGCVFVPIRSMQVLAVMDRDEIIFVHREGRRTIEIAWQRFRPGERDALDEPVAYEAVYYVPDAPETMRRLQGEFQKALHEVENREPVHASARILPMKSRQP